MNNVFYRGHTHTQITGARTVAVRSVAHILNNEQGRRH